MATAITCFGMTACGGNSEEPPVDYTAAGADDINDDSTVATYDDETVTAAEVAAPKVTEYVGAGPAVQGGTQTVNFETGFNTGTGTADAALSEKYVSGIFELPQGTTVRKRSRLGISVTNGTYDAERSVKLGADNMQIIVHAPAAGTLNVYLDNGSSKVSSAGVFINGKSFTFATSGVEKLTYEATAKGDIIIKPDRNKNGTTDVYYLEYTCEVSNTSIESIAVVNKGTYEYMIGQQLDCTGIAVNATHAQTGTVLPVELKNIQIDASGFNANEVGTYQIGVSYSVESNLESSTTTFSTTYSVNVYAYENLKIGVNKIVKDANSVAGNGVYFNHTMRQFYFTGETFSTDGLSVFAVGKSGAADKYFAMNDGEYEISSPDMSTAGKKEIKVSYTAKNLKKAQGLNIYVAEKDAALASATEIKLAVSKDFSTVNIGKKNVAGAYRFKTIQQALEFIKYSGVSDSCKKTIYLAEGTYWEKLEITVPNLTVIGKGQDKTLIEYDALVGEKDEGGFEHTTDSTATMNVRDSATNFKMKDLTLSNYFNSTERFDDFYGNTTNTGERGLAILIQADKVIFENCAFLGYQDTIEVFTGRHYFANCLVTGRTDFIFGSNGTSYFYKCEIRSIYATDNKNRPAGGYVTAMKGNNGGKAEGKPWGGKITYGVIFDDCDFTFENNVPAGSTAVGRTWGADAAVMIMNSRIGAHMAKDTSRFVTMNGNAPANAQFREYNNEGAGALITAVTGVKLLDATAAAAYNNMATIFGTTNGEITYADAWNPRA